MGRTRRVVIALAAAFSAWSLGGPGSAIASAGAAGHAPPVTPGSRYLALGDSVTFGYMESGVVPTPQYAKPSTFLGYPELLGSELHLRVANAACTGETSASFINTSAQSNGCENSPGNPKVGYRRAFPLHVHYTGSQLAYALGYLRAHRDVSLVSLMIGANDGLICIETTKDACSSKSEMNAVMRQVSHNVRHILKAIRERAGYHGQLVIVNYYSPFSAYNSRSRALNAAIDAAAKPFGVQIADGFGAFRRADRHSNGDPCQAGLLTQLGSPSSCGIHPSYAGQSLLAQAVLRAIRL